MKYIEALTEYNNTKKSLFIAGGISGCTNWQIELVNLLKDENIAILNPRRKHFSTDDYDNTEKQIVWEYEHLQKASAISFWFPEETVCPITLFELGTWLTQDKPLFIGVHPDYKRKKDIIIQTKLRKPHLKIVYNLNNLAANIISWIRSK